MAKGLRRGRRPPDPLARLLATPRLARVVPQLAPEKLHELIQHYGVDACADVVAAATPAQLASVFDLDLWRSAQPGHDARFDADRFAEWLELLADADVDTAARVVATMDEHLVVAGFSRYLRVFDPASITATVDGETLEAAVRSPGAAECDLGGYLVRGRTTDAWDAMVAVLFALESAYPERFHAVMRGCRRLSNSTPEVDGLDELLMEPEQLLHDLALARDDRRSERGYSTAADARAFLLAARGRQPPSAASAAGDGLVARSPRLGLIRALMERVADADETVYFNRTGELAFLANTLAAGSSVQGRAFTPREASDAAVAICNLGLEHRSDATGTFLLDHDLVSTFELGWAVLHEDVGMFVATQLLDALSELHSSDDHIQEGLEALRLEITKQREAGTPWRAREALEVIAMLDMPAWVSVLGLLDECPVIPSALTAILEGRKGAISATEFEFISTRTQLFTVTAFMARFVDILSR